MPVVLFRVDDRLVHGQVVEGWVPHVDAQAIVVASDTICRDHTRCRLMEMMMPPGLRLQVVPLSDLSRIIAHQNSTKMIVLFSDLTDVASAASLGIKMDLVNLGNLHHLRGGREIGPSVYLNRGDVEIALRLIARGIHLEVQEVPEGRCADLVDILGGESRS